VQRRSSGDLVAAWRRLLTPLGSTQHLLGPVDVQASSHDAAAACHVRAYHVRKGTPGGDEWMVAGHYQFELSSIGRAWRITAITLQTFYQTGNPMLLQPKASG
jgi:hypothetical protein